MALLLLSFLTFCKSQAHRLEPTILPKPVEGRPCIATAVSDDGRFVVGYSQTFRGPAIAAVLWENFKSPHFITENAFPVAVSHDGRVLIHRKSWLLTEPDSVEYFSPYSNYSVLVQGTLLILQMNDLGEVMVSGKDVSGQFFCFIWSEENGFLYLNPNFKGVDINNYGNVIGYIADKCVLFNRFNGNYFTVPFNGLTYVKPYTFNNGYAGQAIVAKGKPNTTDVRTYLGDFTLNPVPLTYVNKEVRIEENLIAMGINNDYTIVGSVNTTTPFIKFQETDCLDVDLFVRYPSLGWRTSSLNGINAARLIPGSATDSFGMLYPVVFTHKS